MKTKIFSAVAAAAVLATTVLSGCSTVSMDGSTYTAQQMQSGQTVGTDVTILGVRNVFADRSADSNNVAATTGLGAVLGAALGGMITNDNYGQTKYLGTMVGGAAGTYAGSEVGKRMARVPAWEIRVRENASGKVRTIVQEADKSNLRAGMIASVNCGSDNKCRVVPI